MNIKDATYRWVSTFNSIQQNLLLDSLRGQEWKLHEVTTPSDEWCDAMPMLGWMWSFGDSADDWWLEEQDGIEKMEECGFRVYEHEDYGYYFGIDGAGYDFYDAHWIPLYKARGLQWHDEDDE